MLKIEDSKASTKDILNRPHETDDDLLLEIVLRNIRQFMQSYQKQISKNRTDNLKEIETKINELTSSINTGNELEASKILEY